MLSGYSYTCFINISLELLRYHSVLLGITLTLHVGALLRYYLVFLCCSTVLPWFTRHYLFITWYYFFLTRHYLVIKPYYTLLPQRVKKVLHNITLMLHILPWYYMRVILAQPVRAISLFLLVVLSGVILLLSVCYTLITRVLYLNITCVLP